MQLFLYHFIYWLIILWMYTLYFNAFLVISYLIFPRLVDYSFPYLLFSQFLPQPPIYFPLPYLHKSTGFQSMSVSHDMSSCSKTRHLLLLMLEEAIQQEERVPRVGNRVRDSPYCHRVPSHTTETHVQKAQDSSMQVLWLVVKFP